MISCRQSPCYNSGDFMGDPVCKSHQARMYMKSSRNYHVVYRRNAVTPSPELVHLMHSLSHPFLCPHWLVIGMQSVSRVLT